MKRKLKLLALALGPVITVAAASEIALRMFGLGIPPEPAFPAGKIAID